MKFNLKKTSVIVAVTAALLLLVAAVAFSHGHMGRHQGPREGFRGGPGPRDGLGPMMHDLNLTEDQKTQIKKIADSFHQSDEALFDQMRALHTSEPDPLSGTFDEAAVRTAAEARAKIQIELEVSHAKMMSQIAGVLTPDQKTQLAAKRQQFERKGPPPPPDEQK
ncbi:MAG: periplasmic protein CpxP/Spy [Blastocatellia bacterium]|nr:periplasmic protein CpxP/Spy [Blastocatellia bacterium]